MTNLNQVLTTHQISKLCLVDSSTVISWIEQGKLPAYRTPGGHRRVSLKDFLDFMKKYNLPLPSGINVDINPRVMIIDDETEIIKVIFRVLKTLNSEIQIESATDGFEAGRKMADFKPDLVILDLMLPGIDGFEICRTIRKDERLKDARVLAITGYDTPENKKKIFSCGANGYLVKPFDIKDLMAEINKLLNLEV